MVRQGLRDCTTTPLPHIMDNSRNNGLLSAKIAVVGISLFHGSLLTCRIWSRYGYGRLTRENGDRGIDSEA